MSNYLDSSFDRDLRRLFIAVVCVIVGVVVAAFALGRCSRSVSFQSPIKLEQQKESGK